MSDAGRKGLGQQMQEKMTPDSTKSTTDQLKENVTGMYDNAASALQPDGQKSYTQQMGDSTRGTSHDAQNQGKGLFQSASDAVSNAAQSVSDAFNGNNANARK